MRLAATVLLAVVLACGDGSGPRPAPRAFVVGFSTT